MSAFNRRFEPSMILMLPTLCWVGILIAFLGFLSAALFPHLPIRFLAGMLGLSGLGIAVHQFVYRHDSDLLKSYGQNQYDHKTTPFEIKHGES